MKNSERWKDVDKKWSEFSRGITQGRWRQEECHVEEVDAVIKKRKKELL